MTAVVAKLLRCIILSKFLPSLSQDACDPEHSALLQVKKTSIEPPQEQDDTMLHPESLGQYECRMSWCRRADCDSEDPECCNMKMNKMLQDVKGFLKSGGHSWAPTMGTLLGGMRDKKIITWTPDVDISVSEAGIEALLTQKVIPYHFFREAEIVRGCPLEPGGEQRFFVPPGGVTSPTEGNDNQVFYYMDVYPDIFIDTSPAFADGSHNCRRSDNASEGLEIYGETYPWVINADECLQSRYGADWKIPQATDGTDILALTFQGAGEGTKRTATESEGHKRGPSLAARLTFSPAFIQIAFPSIAGAAAAYLFFAWHRLRMLQTRPSPVSIPGRWVLLAWFALCFVLLVGIDILVKTNAEMGRDNTQKTPLVLLVLLAEFCKLLVSLGSLAVSGPSDAQGDNSTQDIIRLGLDLVPVTCAFCLNNVLTFYVLSVMRFDAALVWRNCSLLFTAILWTMLLSRPLGFNRQLAVVLCLTGCFMNSCASSGALEVDAATPIVLLQAASTAIGSVFNEKVIKSEKAKRQSLDLVNALLYSEMVVGLLCFCVVENLAMGTSFSFSTFTPMTWIMIIVYASAGLTVSRVLKYGDAVSYGIMSGLRVPAGILLAPLFLSHTSVSVGTVTSGIVVFLAVIFNATPDAEDTTKP